MENSTEAGNQIEQDIHQEIPEDSSTPENQTENVSNTSPFTSYFYYGVKLFIRVLYDMAKFAFFVTVTVFLIVALVLAVICDGLFFYGKIFLFSAGAFFVLLCLTYSVKFLFGGCGNADNGSERINQTSGAMEEEPGFSSTGHSLNGPLNNDDANNDFHPIEPEVEPEVILPPPPPTTPMPRRPGDVISDLPHAPLPRELPILDNDEISSGDEGDSDTPRRNRRRTRTCELPETPSSSEEECQTQIWPGFQLMRNCPDASAVAQSLKRSAAWNSRCRQQPKERRTCYTPTATSQSQGLDQSSNNCSTLSSESQTNCCENTYGIPLLRNSCNCEIRVRRRNP